MRDLPHFNSEETHSCRSVETKETVICCKSSSRCKISSNVFPPRSGLACGRIWTSNSASWTDPATRRMRKMRPSRRNPVIGRRIRPLHRSLNGNDVMVEGANGSLRCACQVIASQFAIILCSAGTHAWSFCNASLIRPEGAREPSTPNLASPMSLAAALVRNQESAMHKTHGCAATRAVGNTGFR